MDVSIIIPTYNRLWCLPRAIESCRHTVCQTEIIVVDDGSTDGTWEWLQSQTDVIGIRQQNQGQTYAINKGFLASSGEYIRFLDSDDFLVSGIVDTQFQKAAASGAGIVCSRVDLFEEATKKKTSCPDITHWKDFLEIQLGNGYGSHFLGMLFHHSVVEKTPRRPEFAFREDRMFLLEVALLRPKMEIVEGCAGYWVHHHQQMQGNYAGLQSQVVNWQHLQIYRRILMQLDAAGQLLDKYKAAACTVLWPLAHWIAKDHIEAGEGVVTWIYELHPGFKLPQKGILGIVYKTIGFRRAEKLLKVRRFLKRR